jgi:peroxisomal enoyl-CoA hydratase 2
MSGESYRFPVEAGHILTFARALGDPNPVYADEEQARAQGFASVLAPPTFYEASAHFDPHSEVRPQPGQPWFGSAGSPTGDPGREDRNPGTTLHAETHVTYRRHVCAGEVLDVRHRPGRQWTKVGRRGGGLAFEDWYVDYHDRSGQVVLTARTVAVTTAQKLDPTAPSATAGPTTPDAGRGGSGPTGGESGADMTAAAPANSRPPEVDRPAGTHAGSTAAAPANSRPPELDGPASADAGGEDLWRLSQAQASELSVGDTYSAVLVRDLRRVQIIQYAGASGDFSPQHTDEVYNTQVAGYPTVFAHGMLTMGMTARMLTDWLGDARLTHFGMRFLGQVWPGDDLVARATVEALDHRDGEPVVELSVVTVNQHGQPVVSGYATARLDPSLDPDHHER